VFPRPQITDVLPAGLGRRAPSEGGAVGSEAPGGCGGGRRWWWRPRAVEARAPLMIAPRGEALIFSTDAAPGGGCVTAVTTYSPADQQQPARQPASQATWLPGFLQFHRHHHQCHYHLHRRTGAVTPSGRLTLHYRRRLYDRQTEICSTSLNVNLLTRKGQTSIGIHQ